MLFLLPALDAGVQGVAAAVGRSLDWCFGANESGIDFYRYDPFFAYRSIERADRSPRVRRYLRSLAVFASRSGRRPSEAPRTHA